MRSGAALLFCLFAIQPLTRAEMETEDHVLILTNENFDEAIKNKRGIFVFFVAPQSVSWGTLSAEYARAARKLAEKKPLLKFGKVNYTEQTELKERFEIKHPIVKFFKDGKPVDDEVEIPWTPVSTQWVVHWLKLKYAVPEEISTPEELTAFEEARRVVVVGLFKNRESDAAKAFLKVASDSDAPFGISSDDAVHAAAGAEDGQVVLYKKFDEGRSVLDKVGTVENLRKFVFVYSLPLVFDYADKPLYQIIDELGSIELSIMLYIDKRNPNYEQISANFRETAKQFRGTVAFITVHSDHPLYDYLIDTMGLKESDTPRIRIIRRANRTKFKPDDETNLEPTAISAFVQAVVRGEIKPYFRSQDLPEDWDKAPVKVLVGTNFDKIVFDRSKNVLVGFLQRWQPSSRELVPILEQLGEHFRDNGQVVIAKFDACANELEHHKNYYDDTPRLYKKNSNEVVAYKGERFFEKLKEFIETNSDFGEVPAEI